MRLFAALVPPPEALEHLEEFLEPRRAAGTFRWSAAEQWHVTLAFYPDVAEQRIDDLVEALETAATRRRATYARIAGGGAFPHAAAAKVLWAGLDGDGIPSLYGLDSVAVMLYVVVHNLFRSAQEQS